MCLKRSWKTWLCLPLCGLLIWFLADAEQVRCTTSEALSLCARSVIPSLFPFLVVSSLLVSLGFGQWISPYFAGFMTPLFGLPGHASSALVLGLVGGYPIGAQTASNLYQAGLLTRQETQRLLAFCNNSNPVFLISVLGAGIFGSTRIGIWLWLIHVASALITGILFRGRNTNTGPRHTPKPVTIVSFSSAFVSAVRGAAMGMLSICAFVTLFYILAAPLAALPSPVGTLLVGSLELFSLTPLLTPDRFSFILASGCTGWGGLSVLCQTAAVLEGSSLSLRPCILGKLLQGLLSALLAAALSSSLFP